jgi:hypothetical protein
MEIYKDFVRASSNYLSRADEAGLSITGNLTVGGWFYFDAESTGQETGLINKWYETGNERSYVLYKNSSDELVFSISTDGSAVVSINDGGFNYAESQWFYVVGRFTVSTELALFVNGMWYKTTIGIPASIFDCSEAFEIGRYNRSNYLDGKVSQAFICAYSVPDTFICAMFSHAKALYMRWGLYQNQCSSTSSSSTTITSSSTSSSTSISTSSSSESYSTSLSTSSSTTCSSSSSTISSSSTTTSSSSSIPP